MFALILIGMLKIMPESPRYLVAKGKREEAQAALAKVRYEDQLDWEVENIDLEVKEEMKHGVASWPEIFSDDNRMKYRILMGMGLQTVQQLSGMFRFKFESPLDKSFVFPCHCRNSPPPCHSQQESMPLW